MSARTCHCGAPARADGSDYNTVCCQWPLCETRAADPAPAPEAAAPPRPYVLRRGEWERRADRWNVHRRADDTLLGWVCRRQDYDPDRGWYTTGWTAIALSSRYDARKAVNWGDYPTRREAAAEVWIQTEQ